MAWRESDPEKSVRFFAPLLSDTGLMKTILDDLLKTPDLRILGELKTELKK